MTNERSKQVLGSASSRELRLLCLLVETRDRCYSIPLGTMHPVPPRSRINGRWPSTGCPGVILRETQARIPSSEVVARCLQQLKDYALRSTGNA